MLAIGGLFLLGWVACAETYPELAGAAAASGGARLVYGLGLAATALSLAGLLVLLRDARAVRLALEVSALAPTELVAIAWLDESSATALRAWLAERRRVNWAPGGGAPAVAIALASGEVQVAVGGRGGRVALTGPEWRVAGEGFARLRSRTHHTLELVHATDGVALTVAVARPSWLGVAPMTRAEWERIRAQALGILAAGTTPEEFRKVWGRDEVRSSRGYSVAFVGRFDLVYSSSAATHTFWCEAGVSLPLSLSVLVSEVPPGFPLSTAEVVDRVRRAADAAGWRLDFVKPGRG